MDGDYDRLVEYNEVTDLLAEVEALRAQLAEAQETARINGEDVLRTQRRAQDAEQRAKKAEAQVAELEAQRDRNYNGWCEATKEVARRAAEAEALRVRLVLAEGAAAQNACERDNWKQRAEKAEALRAQLAETERNLMSANARLMRANARLMQWESGETERVGAHALKADLQKRLAAAEQRAEKAEAALPPADVMTALRRLFVDLKGVTTDERRANWLVVQAWLATLPTPEAQP